MRIVSVELSGFRAFRDRERFDLNGDVVLVVGANGQGKTSLFDAIYWAVTGEISRLKNPDSIVSLYSASGEAAVELTIASDDGRTLVVTRRFDGQRDRLLVRDDINEFRGEDAEYELVRRLLPDGLKANESPLATLRSAFKRGVYLQQDVLTGFLTADTDQERFNAISELIGVGLATELQIALENSRRAWSRANNQMASELMSREEQLRRLRIQLLESTEAASAKGLSTEEWAAWWVEARRLGVSGSVSSVIDAADSNSAIDAAMAELRAIRTSRERRGARLRELAFNLQELPPKTLKLDELRLAADESALALEDARESLAHAEDTLKEIRRRETETRLERHELRTLAEIALRHLGELCPVCQQTYDTDSTQQYLNSLLSSTFGDTGPPTVRPDLARAEQHVEEMESQAATKGAAFKDALHQAQIRMQGQKRVLIGLTELDINVPSGVDLLGAIEFAMKDNDGYIESLSALGMRGESLALSLARAGQLARKAELEQEVYRADLELGTVRREIQARKKTGELVSNMIDGLRHASSDLVEAELKKLHPLLQRIYSTVDPHPEFRNVRLFSRMQRGRGRVLAEIADPRHGLRIDDPDAFLSSSQLNVLAVSVFLALNLGISTLPLRLATLDDPIQSLDDLNLLGFIDLLKRIRERRQLMVSTHDSRFAALLERKLRPVSDSQRTILVEFSGWSSEGPSTIWREIARDPEPIRIAAA